MLFRAAMLALSMTGATLTHAAEVPPAMADFIASDLKSWVNDPQIVAAIKTQNRANAGLTQAQIIAMDTEWRTQLGTTDTALIDAVLGAPVSAFLKQHLSDAGGRITEVFIMDNHGLNVAASGITSDFWQGDEAKFQKTFEIGAGVVFVDEVELDESTQTYQGQVSFSVTDPVSGEVIGAITVGLDASAFF